MSNIHLFKSATIRLTAWYILILMSISLIFSLSIYNMASHELGTRFDHFQNNFQNTRTILPPKTIDQTFRDSELADAKLNILIKLLYVNAAILFAGGFGSYFFARRSLRPIKMAHEAESRFTSDASHELRTPLAVMKTEIEVALNDKNISKDDLKSILGSNLEEVDKLSKLAEMLLNISRLDNSQLELGQVDLAQVTNSIISDFKLSEKRISIDSPKKLIVHGNSAALSDLVKVLIENALQYSPSNSNISINMSKDEKMSIFNISNTGDGISADKLPYIFERFYRADQSRTGGDKKGYGLGLALAKKIVELHNGELSVVSTVNGITTFTFKIPLK